MSFQNAGSTICNNNSYCAMDFTSHCSALLTSPPLPLSYFEFDANALAPLQNAAQVLRYASQ
jgi:hypothetical protein